jgi:hypothetical protein
MATKTNTIEKNGRLKVPTLPSVFSRAIKANSEWPEKVSSFFLSHFIQIGVFRFRIEG